MIRLPLLLILVIGLSACKGGGGSAETETPPSPEVRPPQVELSLKWGDLSCQKQGRCEDPILNLEKKEVVDFFRHHLPAGLMMPDSPDSSFGAGKVFFKYWVEHFVQFENLEQENFKKLVSLGLIFLEIEELRPSQGLEEKLNSYFINTKEYKNEIK